MHVRPGGAGSIVGVVLLLAVAGGAAAQTTVAPVERVGFDRPEAWAMKYFTSTSRLIAPTGVRPQRRGDIWLGVELVWLPPLDTAQQRVGFNGTAQEDLNQAPLFLRPQVTIGLSDHLALTLAGVPPVRTFGVTARLFTAGLGWTIRDSERWVVAGRADGQVGRVTATITCPSDVLAFEPGSPGNPRGCDAESSDVTTLDYLSIELDVARRLARWPRLTPRASVGLAFVDNAFQANAPTFGTLDRTRLEARGLAYSATFGVDCVLTRRFGLTIEGFYTPLGVRRPPAPSSSIDGLLTLRGLVTYRLR
jgi:hypothetical protein